ncbi:MAG: tripartite tricarboxylate transporter TctB family protein [Pseudomonadota bacterium]
MSRQDDVRKTASRPGEFFFILALTVIAAILLAQIGDQTKFYKRLKLPTQPGFWPAVGLGGMVLSGAALAVSAWYKRRREGASGQDLQEQDLQEMVFIARAGEFMLWFMFYVWITPWAGYLASTILFVMCLAWRAGYRTTGMQALSAGLAVFIVVLFKSFLSVKIPGGAVYDLLPPDLQSFMAINF